MLLRQIDLDLGQRGDSKRSLYKNSVFSRFQKTGNYPRLVNGISDSLTKK